MLKFTGKFKVTDIIRAYDFEPMEGCPESYIIGEVLETDNFERGFRAYKVRQIRHIVDGKEDKDERGTTAWIPHQVSMLEFDERIQLVCGEDCFAVKTVSW